MKRCAILAAVVAAVLSGVLLTRAARPAAAAAPASPRAAGALTGPTGWHYRHSQPTHWRACLLRQ